MSKKTRDAIWETTKFVLRTAVLVGAPAAIAELAIQKPQWGLWTGIAAMVFDKLVHEDKSITAKGLLPF